MTVIGLKSLIVGCLGAILFIRIILPYICLRNYYLELIVFITDSRIYFLLFSMISFLIGCNMRSEMRSIEMALFLECGCKSKFQS